MSETSQSVFVRRYAIGTVLALLAFAGRPSMASADEASERELLAAIIRQLDIIDRLSTDATAVAPQDRHRYHFDHARLRTDVARVRTGVTAYLTPQRAQPRDPEQLSGEYGRSEDARAIKASKP